MHKDCLKKSSRPKSPTARALDHLLVGGGHDHLEVPWEWLLDPKLKIYVETTCCEDFVFYREKNFVSHFSDFVYWKSSIFWQFWAKLVFGQTTIRYWQKMVKIQLQIDFGTNFDFTYKWLDQKPVRTKIGEKWLICSKQSLKNDKQKNFPHKIQNAHSIWFPHRFSISGQKVTPKGQMVMASPN